MYFIRKEKLYKFCSEKEVEKIKHLSGQWIYLKVPFSGEESIGESVKKIIHGPEFKIYEQRDLEGRPLGNYKVEDQRKNKVKYYTRNDVNGKIDRLR